MLDEMFCPYLIRALGNENEAKTNAVEKAPYNSLCNDECRSPRHSTRKNEGQKSVKCNDKETKICVAKGIEVVKDDQIAILWQVLCIVLRIA